MLFKIFQSLFRNSIDDCEIIKFWNFAKNEKFIDFLIFVKLSEYWNSQF